MIQIIQKTQQKIILLIIINYIWLIVPIINLQKKSLNTHGEEPASKKAKMTNGHVLAKSIVVIIKKMQASQKEKYEVIKVHKQLEALEVLELLKF